MVNYSLDFYKDKRFERYVEKERQRQVVASSQKCSTCRVLDIGPGAMTYYNHIQPWSKYLIVDPVKEFITRLPAHVVGICSTFEEVEFKTTFDFIIISGMLHLIKDRDTFLKKVRSVCHKKTLVHINVPNANSLHRVLGQSMGLLKDIRDLSETDKAYEHGKNFTINELMKLLINHKFKIAALSTYQLKPFSDGQMSKIADESVARGLQKMIPHFSQYGCEIATEVKIC